MSQLDRFEGAILGLAIGDALGFPCEFHSRAQILRAFPPRGVTGMVALHDAAWRQGPLIAGPAHPAGTYSDDTQMTIAVAEALIAAGHGDLETLMSEMAARFVAWSRAADNDRSPGNACMTGCSRLARGVGWRQSGVADSKGCGSAMRVAPIGLYFARNRKRLLEVARASSLPTHGHDAAIEGAAAAALAVAFALEGAAPAEIHAGIVAECSSRSHDLAARLEQLPTLLEAEEGVALSERGLGESWVAEEAVACALWCVWRAPDDFVGAVLPAANSNGDSDSVACIAGGISGARLGAAAIPEEWRRGVENAEGLRALAGRLWRAAGSP